MRFDEAPSGTVDVLIADDDDVVRASVRSFLELQGLTCDEARDGPEAVEAALRRPPRCVLLDLSMPGLDGFAVARQLRADPRTCGAHVHCLTAHVDPLSRQRAEEAGCELFLTKPVEPGELLLAVRGEIGQQQPHQVRGLTKWQAEGLLDWLEAHSTPGQVHFSEAEAGFAVSWQPDAQQTTDPLRCRRRRRDPCPNCGSTCPPYMKREMAALSWALVGLGVLLWPLLPLGALLRRDVWRCWECHSVVGLSSRLTLGR
jgi:CheY-like chemotaxis protein